MFIMHAKISLKPVTVVGGGSRSNRRMETLRRLDTLSLDTLSL